jgi:hypothetical protein
LLPPAPTLHAELGQRAAVAVVTTLYAGKEVALANGRCARETVS